MKKILWLTLFVVCFCATDSLGQTNRLSAEDSLKTTGSNAEETQRNRLFGLPIIYYTPETKLAYGATGIYTFRFKHAPDTARPSQIQLALAHTQLNQILVYLPFQLFWQGRKYTSYGELGYYKYTYFFYGIGDEHPPNAEETYDVKYPRVRLNLLRKIVPGVYLGLRYWFEDYNITQRDSTGMLIKDEITGSEGGISSGLGVVANYDTRDNVFFPSRGAYVETVIHPFHHLMGGDFNYTRFLINASKYYNNKWGHVMAFNFYGDFIAGDPPFNQMALLGGSKRMRGYIEGEYRDKSMLIFQAAYRAPLFWRIGAVGFAGYGGVADKIGSFDLKNFKYSYGGGLRFLLDKEKKLNIRFDVGFTENDIRYYLTFGEAF